MNYTDCYPQTSSLASSIDKIYLPKSRIKCSRDQINIGGSSFKSASDALLVYLQQYDTATGNETKVRQQDSPSDLLVSGQKGGESQQLAEYLAMADSMYSKDLDGMKPVNSVSITRGIEDVDDLLTSRLHAEVTEAVREMQLQHGKKERAPDSHSHSKTDLQHEVEAALLRSAKLLEKVAKEGNASTRTLISERQMLQNNSVGFLRDQEAERKEPGHIYSYHSSRHRKSQNSPMNSLHSASHQQPQELRRCLSTDNLLPASHRLPPRSKNSFNSAPPSSHHSDPTDVLRSLRTRSLSPALRNLKLSTSGLMEKTDPPVRKIVPSWVRELTPSEVTDSLWETDSVLESRKNMTLEHGPISTGSVPVVSNIKGSDSCKDSDVTGNSELNGNKSVTTNYQSGFNLSDLGISSIHLPNNSKHNTFINGMDKKDLRHRIRHSSPIRDNLMSIHTDPLMSVHSDHLTSIHADPLVSVHAGPLMAIHSDPLVQPLASRTFDTEYNGEAVLHRNILPQTARLKKCIENFVASSENLKLKSLTSSASGASSDGQCSSLDTLSLLTGKPLSRKDAAVASSLPQAVPKDSSSYPSSPVVSTSGQRGHSSPGSTSHELTSDGLDGDRPWEKVTVTFKPPVPVDGGVSDINTSPHKTPERTLSGRKQPGSMETLKNMLFKLQAEENATHQEISKNNESLPTSHSNNSKPHLEIIPALQDYDFEKEPGGQSLEKALVHLNRLKELVQSTNASVYSDAATKSTTTSGELPANDVLQADC